jgi:O-antigen/teichoic acid export membrane protein
MTSQLDQSNPQRRLRDRALSAGAWTLSAYGAELSVRLFSNLLLTRLLFPEAFGAIAAAMALVTGLALVSDFGVQAVVVQSPYGDQIGFLRSAWVFQLWRGFVIWIVLVALCALLSLPAVRNLLPSNSAFADRSLPLVTVALGLCVIISGAESTSIALNVRRLNFGPIVWLDLTSKILSLPVMLTWAWFAPSVWAIAGGMVVGSLVRLVLSHTWVPGPGMRLNWERDHFHSIVRFGRWIMVSSIATFISQQCDVILLGILTPASTLGLYSIAKLLTATGEGFLDRLNYALALPVFGEIIRKDPRTLRNRYYRFRLPIDLAAGLLGGALFAAGGFIVHFLYDTRYEQAGTMLQILALGTATYPFLIIGSAFTAIGETHISAIISVSKAASLVACMAIGFWMFGLLGAVAGVAFHRVFPSILILALAHRRRWIGLWYELRTIPAFIGGLLLGKGCVLIATALDIHNIHQFLHLWGARS